MEGLAEKLTNFILRKGAIEERDYEIYKYGFQSGIEVIACCMMSVLIAIYFGSIFNKNKATVEQSPMYFMQLLASTMPCDNEKAENKMETEVFVSHNVAEKYEEAKRQLGLTNVLRGISHAHYVDTYVLLSEQAKSKDFK